MAPYDLAYLPSHAWQVQVTLRRAKEENHQWPHTEAQQARVNVWKKNKSSFQQMPVSEDKGRSIWAQWIISPSQQILGWKQLCTNSLWLSQNKLDSDIGSGASQARQAQRPTQWRHLASRDLRELHENLEQPDFQTKPPRRQRRAGTENCSG